MQNLLRVVGSQSLKECIRTSSRHLNTAQRICGTHFDRVVPARQNFKTRHIGPNEAQKKQMLEVVGCKVIYILLTHLFILYSEC
jgi:hypothetical protein